MVIDSPPKFSHHILIYIPCSNRLFIVFTPVIAHIHTVFSPYFCTGKIAGYPRYYGALWHFAPFLTAIIISDSLYGNSATSPTDIHRDLKQAPSGFRTVDCLKPPRRGTPSRC